MIHYNKKEYRSHERKRIPKGYIYKYNGYRRITSASIPGTPAKINFARGMPPDGVAILIHGEHAHRKTDIRRK